MNIKGHLLFLLTLNTIGFNVSILAGIITPSLGFKAIFAIFTLLNLSLFIGNYKRLMEVINEPGSNHK